MSVIVIPLESDNDSASVIKSPAALDKVIAAVTVAIIYFYLGSIYNTSAFNACAPLLTVDNAAPPVVR